MLRPLPHKGYKCTNIKTQEHVLIDITEHLKIAEYICSQGEVKKKESLQIQKKIQKSYEKWMGYIDSCMRQGKFDIELALRRLEEDRLSHKGEELLRFYLNNDLFKRLKEQTNDDYYTNLNNDWKYDKNIQKLRSRIKNILAKKGKRQSLFTSTRKTRQFRMFVFEVIKILREHAPQNSFNQGSSKDPKCWTTDQLYQMTADIVNKFLEKKIVEKHETIKTNFNSKFFTPNDCRSIWDQFS